jgi:thiamine-monophosphate kinase
MIDISDGLSVDLAHICEESRCGALIYERDIPISGIAKQKAAKPLAAALYDGEDFELLFTLSKKESEKLQKKRPFRTRISRIGHITKKDLKIARRDGKVETVRPRGYEHLR